MKFLSFTGLSLLLTVAESSATVGSPNYVEALLSHALKQTPQLGSTHSGASVPGLEATYIVYGASLSASAGAGEILEGSKGLEIELHFRKEQSL